MKRLGILVAPLLAVTLFACADDLPPEEVVGGGADHAVSEFTVSPTPPCKPVRVHLLVANASSGVARTCSREGASFVFDFATTLGPERKGVEFHFETQAFANDRAALERAFDAIVSRGIGRTTERFLLDVIAPAAGDPARAADLFRDHLVATVQPN
jgi:hypothetical protein